MRERHDGGWCEDRGYASRRYWIRPAEIGRALALSVYSGRIGDDPPKYLVIGFDSARRLLEIVYVTNAAGDITVIHAMKLRKKYYSLLRG